jgi:catechol 2,3-dioxygenase-like lactoylglutathione lyase family enzyme
MFRDTKAFSGFAVPDVAAAKAFYGDVLGIHVTEDDGMLTLHLAGGRDTFVYPKPDFVPATYTILNFPVDDIDEAVDELTAAACGSSGTRERRSRPTPRGSSDRVMAASRGSPTRPATFSAS